jgi:feruloyl esterase
MHRTSALKWIACAAATVLFGAIAACGGSDGTTPAPTPTALTCDDSMKTAFVPDAQTQVRLVKAFKKGDALLLSGTATASTPIAGNDMCFVKLLVGPGHPGPASAPATTAGIGIEIWLPAKAAWNGRVHVLGGAGWAGGVQTSLTAIGGGFGVNPWDVAGLEGAVSATTDTGHVIGNGNFLMNADGSINTVGWNEFSERGIHEMTVKAKALALAYFGTAAKYTYWHGGSTGGRQGLKQAQAYPEDFDGIIATSPAINWSRFTTSMLYGQVVTQRDLGGVGMTSSQVGAASKAAIAACDLVGGQHLGYLLDPAACTYDPAQDAAALCVASGGTNSTSDCITTAQALALNKVWYGQTRDGSVPAPATDVGYEVALSTGHLWYGYARGASIAAQPFPGFGTITGPTTPTSIATDFVALELQDPTLATPAFINATGNGADGWKNLTYAGLAHAADRGLALQAAFSSIDTDNPDLSKFAARGGKLITVYGTSDNVIPYPGIINYYNRVATQLGGLGTVQSFYKLYLVPGMGHFPSNGTVNATANPPIPTEADNYALLTDWVEKGIAPPDKRTISSPVTPANLPPVTGVICVYPKKAAYAGGDIKDANSYACL